MKCFAIVALVLSVAVACERKTLQEVPPVNNQPATEHLAAFLDRKGDSYDKISDLASAIQEKIDDEGLELPGSPESELDRISTWEERAIIGLVSFYSMCSNNGRVYPHLDFGLSLTAEFEAVGAQSTVRALRELEELRQSGFELRDDEQVTKIEYQVPGDFIWADPILEYVKANPSRFMQAGG